jgi:hypothetical protein
MEEREYDRIAHEPELGRSRHKEKEHLCRRASMQALGIDEWH